MNLTALFEKVVGKQRHFQVDFHALVRQLADDQAPDPEIIARMLQDAGKTTDELRRAVEQVQERRQLYQVMDRAATVETERASIRKQIAEADRTLAAAEQEHRNFTEPLSWELDRLAQVGREAEAARRRLLDTCTDAELMGAMTDVNSERQVLTSRRGDLASRRQELRNLAAAARDEAAAASSGAIAEQLQERHRRLLTQAKEHDRDLARLEKRLTQLDQQERDLREKMLQP